MALTLSKCSVVREINVSAQKNITLYKLCGSEDFSYRFPSTHSLSSKGKCTSLCNVEFVVELNSVNLATRAPRNSHQHPPLCAFLLMHRLTPRQP